MDEWQFLAVFATVGTVVLFSALAAVAFGWAVKDGQFRNLERGSRSIFDPDEPIGEPTDARLAPESESAEHEPDDDAVIRRRNV